MRTPASSEARRRLRGPSPASGVNASPVCAPSPPGEVASVPTAVARFCAFLEAGAGASEADDDADEDEDAAEEEEEDEDDDDDDDDDDMAIQHRLWGSLPATPKNFVAGLP
jgi:hypothetical protein